jgi:hypothetical protein
MAEPAFDSAFLLRCAGMRVPVLVRLLALATVVVIPLRVLGTGFLPPDDALRHAAKVVSGKAWVEIMVLRSDVSVDPHPGWHALLGWVHRSTGAGTHSLVLAAVLALFFALHAPPLLLLRRPEAWLMAWGGFCVLDPPGLVRFMLGRPFLVSVAAFLTLCLLWRRLAEPRLALGAACTCAVAVAVAAWTHPSWYLFALFPLTLLLVGEARAALRLSACLVGGVALAALLSGQPGAYVYESVRHPFLVLGRMDAGTLATELRPNSTPPFVLLGLLGLLGFRALRGRWRSDVWREPVLALAAAGWILGYVSLRFWSDWGLPAALVWAARELEEWLEELPPVADWRRLGAAAALGAAVLLASSSDVMGRWSVRLDRTYAPLLEPQLAEWLPGPGGILYSPDVILFHQLFYHRPDAPWRYMVGFEPGLMPSEDLAVYRDFMRRRRIDALAPWVARMRPHDRLVFIGPPASPTGTALEWKHLGGTLWVGRLGSHASANAR